MEPEILIHLVDTLVGLTLPWFLAALTGVGFLVYVLIVGLVVILSALVKTDDDD